jgi:hypothetical protein
VAVVPAIRAAQTPAEKDAAVEAFRTKELRSRVWHTRGGDRLLKWFWKTWLGMWLVRKFPRATAEELHGYAFWGPVALAVLVTELLGTGWVGWVGSFDGWPTISTTVGHLQDLNSNWGLPVVGLIGIAAFYAMAYETRPTSEGKTELLLLRGRLRYGWPLVFGVTALATVIAYALGADRFQLGYALYGSLALFGIVVPLLLVHFKSRHVVFPTLFFTFKCLRDRFRWVAACVAAGLAILVIHLALYPWPNLAREPAKFAGSTGIAARLSAERALKAASATTPDLVYSTRTRSVSDGRDAWFIYFNVLTGHEQRYAGCFVVVAEGRKPKPAPDCFRP